MFTFPILMLVFIMAFADAFPLTPRYPQTITRATYDAVPRQRSTSRTLVTAICLFCMFLLAMSQGLRCGRLGRRMRSKVIEVLVLAELVVSVAFVTSVAVMEAGLGLQTEVQCHAAIRVCIAMYGSGKIVLYLFLVERVHIVRAPFAHRFRDPVWVFGVLITVGGLGSIVGVEYIAPRSSISPGDGQCQMGIVPKTAIAIMSLDLGIGAILTGIFVWIMRSSFWPVGSMSMQPTSASDHDGRSGQRRWSRRLTRCSSRSGLREERKKKARSEKTSREQLQGMLWRNIIGSTIALAATVANNLIFLVWSHAGRSYVCFLACMLDVVISMLVMNWLTLGSSETKSGTKQSSVASGATLFNTQGSRNEGPADGNMTSSLGDKICVGRAEGDGGGGEGGEVVHVGACVTTRDVSSRVGDDIDVADVGSVTPPWGDSKGVFG